MLDKRGQIADTMTWVVATLVIVVILGILVFVTIGVSGNKSIFLEDKEKDFIATKSITSFLRNNENINLLQEKNYGGFKSKTEILLKDFPKPLYGGGGKWNFEMNGEGLSDNYKILLNFGQYDYFETTILFSKIELKYWLECQGKCK